MSSCTSGTWLPTPGVGRGQTWGLRWRSTAALTGKVRMGARVMKEGRRINVCFAHKIFTLKLHFKKHEISISFPRYKTFILIIRKRVLHSFINHLPKLDLMVDEKQYVVSTFAS